MIPLTIARTDLATALEALLAVNVSIVDHLPDSITPPCVLVAWADPWLAPATLCQYVAAMELMVIAQRIEPGGKLETLEEIVGTIVPYVKKMPGYQVVDATAPYPLQIAGVDYLAASVNLTYDVMEG